MTQAIFDHDLALERAGGKANLARDLMVMLQEDLPQQRGGIQALWQTRDLEALHKLVHKVHGGTRYCGVPQLQQCCDRLETAIEQGDGDLADHYEALLLAIDDVLQQDPLSLFE